MTPAEITEMFEPWRKQHLRAAWKPVVDTEPASERQTWFGGTPSHSSSEEWPVCRECRQPMQFFLQLDVSELPEGFDANLKSGQIQLFYCSGDDGMCSTWEPFSGTHEIRVLTDESRAITRPDNLEALFRTVVTGWNEIQDAPHPEEHEDLGLMYDYDFDRGRVSVKCQEPPIELQDADLSLDVAEAIALPQAGDKLGGWPYWIQGPEYPDCPECGTPMRLVFQIDSEDNLPHMFGDMGCAHLTQCPGHSHVFAFGWACG